jgi:hypothetical protein
MTQKNKKKLLKYEHDGTFTMNYFNERHTYHVTSSKPKSINSLLKVVKFLNIIIFFKSILISKILQKLSTQNNNVNLGHLKKILNMKNRKTIKIIFDLLK